MIFEEEYPGLKGKGLYDYPDIDTTIKEYNEEREKILKRNMKEEKEQHIKLGLGYFNEKIFLDLQREAKNSKPKTEKNVSVFLKTDILETCLDKAREFHLTEKEFSKLFCEGKIITADGLRLDASIPVKLMKFQRTIPEQRLKEAMNKFQYAWAELPEDVKTYIKLLKEELKIE